MQSKIEVYIHFPFVSGPGGGGSSFLANLRDSFKLSGNLALSVDKADIVLFNSHHDLQSLLRFKKKYPTKYFVQRIDGPMSLYNNSDDLRDEQVKVAAHFLADAYVFQSQWCLKKNDELQITLNKPREVIGNAVNEFIFSPKLQPSREGKLKLITHSWSTNLNKGFGTIEWMDQNLDWAKYEMTFIGNTPLKFKNIKVIPPLDRDQLAERLRASDVFIFPSRFEACSNALLEAQSIGLPVVAFDGSSNPEFVNLKDLLFSEDSEIKNILENLNLYYEEIWAKNSINRKYISLSARSEMYLRFFSELSKTTKDEMVNYFRPKFLLWELKILSKIKGGAKLINFRKDFFGGDASLNTISNFFQAAVNILITILMARFLSKEQMALYPYFFSLQGLFSLLAIPGQDTMLNKAAIINDTHFIKKAFKRMLFSTTLGALFLSLGLFISQKFSLFSVDSTLIYYLTFFSLPFYAMERIEHTLLGFNQFKILAKYRFIFSLVLLLVSLSALFITRNALWVIGAYLFSRCVQMIYGQRQLRRIIFENEKKNEVLVESGLKEEGIRILFYNMANSIIANIQPSFLYHLSPIQLANFSMGTKLPDKIKDYSKIIISAPLQKWLAKGGRHFADKIGLYASFYLVGSILFSCLLAVTAPIYIPLIFGKQYTDAVLMAQLMSFTIPPKVAGSTFQQREIVLENNKYYIYSGYIQLIINTAILYPLIKTYQGVGICIASLVQSYMIFFFSLGRFIWWKRRI